MSVGINETDYLVIGTGAAAMAFVDTLLTESDAQVVMVDRRHRPGGHWNDAYSFVKLHGPSALYGVASKDLGRAVRETVGCTKEDYELASLPEIMDYYDDLMRHRFVESGRVQWLPMSEYQSTTDGVHHVTSLLTGERRRFRARRKLVDATLSDIEVPSTHPPRYAVAQDVRCIPINDLPKLARPHPCYTVIGSGKTSMDACLWLMQHGVDPAKMRWIRPRDHWMLRRVEFASDTFQPATKLILAQAQAIIDATSVPDLFRRLEDDEVLVRIDPTVEPTTYRCAIVSIKEVAQLRRIRDVVRLGHVVSIRRGSVDLERGSVDADPDTLYVDCSASGIQPKPNIPVFDGDVVNLLNVMWCRPVFSAAFIAFVESRIDGDDQKNSFCSVVPNPENPIDWLRMWVASFANMAVWRESKLVREWIAGCRLDFMHALLREQNVEDPDIKQTVAVLQEKMASAAEKLPKLLH